jgi:hypothetical protein
MFSLALDVFLSASPSFCSPALRQLTLLDGSWRCLGKESSPCLEAGRGWLWRSDGSIPLSRPSSRPFSVGKPPGSWTPEKGKVMGPRHGHSCLRE